MRRTQVTTRRQKEVTEARSRAGAKPASRGAGKPALASPTVAAASLRRSELVELLNQPAEEHLSLYMPIHAPGAAGAENPVRLKNLLREAESRLAQNGLPAAEARAMLKPAQALEADARFWQQSEGGLALLVTPQACRAFRLPRAVAEHVHVGQRFQIRPLLELVDRNGHYWLLAVSQNMVRLFRGGADGLTAVDVEGLPSDMAAALNLDMSIASDQVHSATNVPLGKQAAVFHGQGGEADTRKEELKEYFRIIDAALRETLQTDPAPLVVACVEYEFALYRETNSFANLVDRPLAGNVEHLSPAELHAKAWPLVQSHLHQARRHAADRYRQLVPAGKATPHITEILPAASEGRVETLFVPRDVGVWGVHDSASGATEVHAEQQPGDDDLLELATLETLTHAGTVYSVAVDEMPETGKAAAILRY